MFTRRKRPAARTAAANSASSTNAPPGQVTGFRATRQIATTRIFEAVVDIGTDILREVPIPRYRYR